MADHWQAQSQYEVYSLDSDRDHWQALEEDAERGHRKAEQRVQHLLGLLPERERNVLTLRYLRGYTASEIASVLGTNASH
ncbi:sigma factor-like helix-turn-helix DNA-binding protein [Ktedonobacter sp. SOSP1-85]|uniref:sigma factor-like helix-turn-helix DNA-binding protein n=1 Tax=Ktedonobacter sp. SOSP1-85 TaxID=2778367 RepID=UPI0035B2BA85